MENMLNHNGDSIEEKTCVVSGSGHDAKIIFAPGKASNAGGVAVSGLEMTQNSIRLNWTTDELDEPLKNIMKSIHSQCVTFGDEDGYVNYVKGANLAEFVKVADAMKAYGAI